MNTLLVIRYELVFWIQQFNVSQLLLFVVTVVSAVVINIGGASSFFEQVQKFSPEQFAILKNKNLDFWLSLTVVVAPNFIGLVIESQKRAKESRSLAEVARKLIIPSFEKELRDFQADIQKRFPFRGIVRASVFMPIRVGWFNWRHKMLIACANIKPRERDLEFKLYEGAIGYTCLLSKAYTVKFLNVSEPEKLPETYTYLSENNRRLVARNIKTILTLASYQEGKVIGLLALDAGEKLDLGLMEDEDLHDFVLDWVKSKDLTFFLLWKAVNHE